MELTFQAVMMLLIGGIPLMAICSYISRSRFNEFVAIHLIVFWLEMFFYGAIWIVFRETYSPLSTALLFVIACLLCVYVACTFAFASPLRKYSGLAHLLICGLSPACMAAPLVAWLAVKGALYWSYGTTVFGANDAREVMGVPIIYVGLDSGLLLPAWGAFFAFLVRFRLFRTRDFAILPLWVLFLVVNLFFENNGGGKRVLITAALMYLFAPARPVRLTFRSILSLLLALTLTVVGANYYEETRTNFGTFLDTNQGAAFPQWADVYNAFQPRDQHGTLTTELQGRESPLALLYDLTEAQRLSGLAHGVIVRQIMENTLPNGLFTKNYENEGVMLSRLFKLPDVDLAKSSLAVLQAETFILAYMLTPLLYIALMYIYYRAFLVCSRGGKGVIQGFALSVILGAIVNTAAQIEGTPTALFAIFREVIATVVCVASMALAAKSSRRTRKGCQTSNNSCSLN
jgi:hypothetical protein